MNIEYGRLRVLRRELRAAADGRPEEDRERRLAAEHVVDLRGLIDDLVHRDKARTSPAASRRSGGSREPAAPIAMPVIAASAIGVALIRLSAELLEQRRDRVGRHVEDLGIAPHLLGDGLDAAWA